MIVVYSSSLERVSRRDANKEEQKNTKNIKKQTTRPTPTRQTRLKVIHRSVQTIYVYTRMVYRRHSRRCEPRIRRLVARGRVVALLWLSIVHDEFIEQWPQSLVQEVSECGNHHRQERRPIRRARRVLDGRRGRWARAPFKKTKPPSPRVPNVASAPSRLRWTGARASRVGHTLTHLSIASLWRRTRDRVASRPTDSEGRSPHDDGLQAAAGRHTPTRDAATRAPSERANERVNDRRVTPRARRAKRRAHAHGARASWEAPPPPPARRRR